MKKTWFIIEKDYHRGPYSFEDLKTLKGQGKLNDRSLLWQDGNTSGITFAQASDIERKITETLIPDFPATIKIFDPNEPPQLPGELNHSKERFLIPTVQPSILDKIDTVDFNNQVTKTGIKKIIGMYILILFGLVLIIGGSLFYIYIGRTPSLEYPTDMSQSDYERLSPVVEKRFIPETIFEIAVSKDSSRLWLAVNYPYRSDLLIEMTSIKEMTLQNKEIRVTAKATLDNYFAEFKDFKIEGSEGKFYPGFYQLKISLIDSLDTNLMMKLIYRNKVFKDIQVKEFFWGQGNKEDFLKLLKSTVKTKTEVVEEIETETVQLLREKQEKLRTLLSLVNLTDEETTNVLNTIETKKLLKDPIGFKKLLLEYEKTYIHEVAPLLTSLGQGPDTDEAKKLGKLFVETLDAFKGSLKKLNKKKTKTKQNTPILSNLTQDHLLKFKELEATLENKLKLVEETITAQKTLEQKSKSGQ